MSKPKVLIVDGDEWIARMLADGLRDRSFDVRVTLTGSEGLHAMESVAFDCVVVDPVVPGLGGYALVRAIRRMKGPRAKVPVIFLSSTDDDEARAAAFKAGGDVYLTKPFRLMEVAIQVRALVRMARRMTSDKVSSSSSLDALPVPLSPQTRAFEGDLQQMSLASVLTLLEMERRSGEVTVKADQGECVLVLAGGTIVRTSLRGEAVDPVIAIAEMLRWKTGRFVFEPGERASPKETTYRAIGHLLLEATRLHDEAAAGLQSAESDGAPPSSRASWPPPSTWAKRKIQPPPRPSMRAPRPDSLVPGQQVPVTPPSRSAVRNRGESASETRSGTGRRGT